MAGFTWNKAGVAALITPIANWAGTLAADGASSLSSTYLGTMPDDVHAAIWLAVSAGIAAAAVYLVPNHEPPVTPAESNEHA